MQPCVGASTAGDGKYRLPYQTLRLLVKAIFDIAVKAAHFAVRERHFAWAWILP